MTKTYKLIIGIFFVFLILLFLLNCVSNNIVERFSNSEPFSNNSESDLDFSTNPSDSFCKSHEGASDTLEKSCNNLTNNNCNSVSCCISLNGSKCVAGKQNGPTFQTDPSGNKINFDYYYYQNKCYGNCPSS